MAAQRPDLCPSCGTPRPAHVPGGLCPRFLLRAGLDSDALSLTHPGEVGATVDLSPPGVLETLAATLGPVPWPVPSTPRRPATGSAPC